MRCAEVTRELSAPTGALDEVALAGHLASCARCAALAGRSRRFDRLWDATRPEPPAAAWESLWGRVSEALDAPATVAFAPAPASCRPHWARPARIGAGLAAAALVVATSLTLGRRDDGRRHRDDVADAVPPKVERVMLSFVADEGGDLKIYHLDDGQSETVAPADDAAFGYFDVDPNFVMMSWAEVAGSKESYTLRGDDPAKLVPEPL